MVADDDTQSKLVKALDGDIEAFDVDHEMRAMESGLIRLIQQGRDTIADLFATDLGVKNEVSDACYPHLLPERSSNSRLTQGGASLGSSLV